MAECAKCGNEIIHPEDVDVCAEDHDDRPDDAPVLLHADCACPDHGWDGDREPWSQDESAFDD